MNDSGQAIVEDIYNKLSLVIEQKQVKKEKPTKILTKHNRKTQYVIKYNDWGIR